MGAAPENEEDSPLLRDTGSPARSNTSSEQGLGVREFSWRHISFKLGGRSKANHKAILDGSITGSVLAGEVMGILGPSGGGKTTLLSVLSGRWRQGVEWSGKSVTCGGEVRIDGEATKFPFSKARGVYVMQESFLNKFLTVREEITFSARLRCRGKSSAEIKAIAAALIDTLSLDRVADNRCCSLSGGERKRAYIATLLVHDPEIVILDEPLSGLDAESAASVLHCLRRLADQKRCLILVTIHQPTQTVLNKLCKVMVVADGQMVYCGTPGGISPFLSAAGWAVPKEMSVAEYFLKLIAPSSSLDREDQEEGAAMPPVASRVEVLREQCAKTLSAADEVGSNSDMGGRSVSRVWSSGSTARGAQSDRAPFFKQVWVLLCRNVLSMVRDSSFLCTIFVTNLLFGLIAATLFSKLSDGRNKYSLTMAILLFFLNSGVQSSSLGVAQLSDTFNHFAVERDSRMYRTSAWLVAHILVRIPVVLLAEAELIGVSYHFMKLNENRDAVIYFYASMCAFFLVSCTFGEVCGVLTPNRGVAHMVADTYNALAIVFSGAFVMYPDIPVYWQWAYWVSIFQYAFSGAIVSNFRGAPDGWAHIEFMAVQLKNRWTHLIILGALYAVLVLVLYVSLATKKRRYRGNAG